MPAPRFTRPRRSATRRRSWPTSHTAICTTATSSRTCGCWDLLLLLLSKGFELGADSPELELAFQYGDLGALDFELIGEADRNLFAQAVEPLARERELARGALVRQCQFAAAQLRHHGTQLEPPSEMKLAQLEPRAQLLHLVL